jgi:hypothetical protein
MAEVVQKYPAINPTYADWLNVLAEYNLLGDGISNAVICQADVDEYLDEIHNNYGAFDSLDDEKAEQACSRLEVAFRSFADAFKKATGLEIATQYVGQAEDSYADAAEEWIFFVTNAEKTALTAPAKRFIKAGLHFSDLSWTIYG